MPPMLTKTGAAALCLAAALTLSSCSRLSSLTRPQPTPVATATPTPPPVWLSAETFRVAMTPASANDVDLVEHPTIYHLQVHLFLGASQPRVQVDQTTYYTNRSADALDRIYFRLFPNKPSFGTELAFAQVRVDGREATLDYESARTAVGVTLPSPLPPGGNVAVEMKYNVTVPVDNARGYGTYNYQDEILLLSNFFAQVAVYDSAGWNLALAPDYGDPVFAETSLFWAEVTAPTELVLVASGSNTTRVSNDDGSTTWTFVSGPMRDFMLVGSARFKSASLAVGPVRVNSYFVAEHEDTGKKMLEFARNGLRAYQESFGAYPFAEFDVVEAPVSGGMEYPGLILIDTRQYSTAGEYLEFITAHEVAHQWWYSLVGNDQVAEPWLDEGLTNFSTVYYYENVYGLDRARLAFDGYVAGRYLRVKANGQDAVVNQPVSAFTPELYSAIVYGKAAMFFQEVRAELGNETFLAVLRAYLADRRYGVARPEDWLRVAEQVSGQDLHQLYSRWILEVN